MGRSPDDSHVPRPVGGIYSGTIRLLSIATTKAVGYINTNMKIELDTNIKNLQIYDL